MEYTQRGPVQGEKRFADDAFDSLTGVWNEPSVKRQIQGVMHGGGALFLCDIDCLKRINAQFGHLAGDDCLKQAAQILNYMIRKEDILGRTGGDEFVIFAPGCRDIETAGELGRRMEARFTSNRKKGSKEADFTMRIACTLRRKGDTYQSMLERVQEELRNKKYNISDWGGGITGILIITGRMLSRFGRTWPSRFANREHTAGIMRPSNPSIVFWKEG